MWLLFGAIIGIFIIGSGIYLSENVIRGIYNEEIKYVKTNKLRYDWNWLINFCSCKFKWIKRVKIVFKKWKNYVIFCEL